MTMPTCMYSIVYQHVDMLYTTSAVTFLAMLLPAQRDFYDNHKKDEVLF